MENILTGFKRHFIERLRSLSGTPSSIAGGAAGRRNGVVYAVCRFAYATGGGFGLGAAF